MQTAAASPSDTTITAKVYSSLLETLKSATDPQRRPNVWLCSVSSPDPRLHVNACEGPNHPSESARTSLILRLGPDMQLITAMHIAFFQRHGECRLRPHLPYLLRLELLLDCEDQHLPGHSPPP